MIKLRQIRDKAINSLSSGSFTKTAAGEFSIDNILNRVFEEYGVGVDEQSRILDAIKKGGKGAKKITPENAKFFEDTFASGMNKLLNLPSYALRPSLKKLKYLTPSAAMFIGAPILLAGSGRFLYNKIKNR